MTDIKKAEPGCTWVKPGWALQPTDFIRDDKGRMTAGESGIAWTITQRDHLWQRPNDNEPDVLHLMKSIKTEAHSLPEPDKQRLIWRMKQAIRQVAGELVVIRDDAKVMAAKGGDDE